MNTKVTTEGSPPGAPHDGGMTASEIPARLRITAIVLRALFIAVLLVVTVRVSAPQSESVWSAYETPGDLIRLALGFAVGLWILFHLFMLPKDADGYRTWVYLGLVAAPFALALAFAVW
jgi:TRAP-type C4-dicarboxylate transport system permease small subunit